MKQSIDSRRQVVVRTGLGLIVLVGILLEASACIFDKGDFKQGGRLEHAATAAEVVSGTSNPLGDDDDDTTTGTSSGTSGTSSGTSGAATVDAGDAAAAQ